MNGLLTESDAALYLKVSVGLLRKWRLFGHGPQFVKLGRLVRYQIRTLEEYVDAATVATAR